MKFAYLALSLILALCLSSFALAQSPQSAEDIAAAQAAREAAESRIDADMVSMEDMTEALAKTIGRLHYLRTLCFGKEDQLWRDYMGQLLQIEAPKDATKRDYLTAAFNDGYYLEEARFSVCSSNVSVDAAALAENGRRLSSMLGDPYRDF